MLQTFHIFTAQCEQRNASISEKILNKFREQVWGIFLVQNNSDRMKRQIADSQLFRVFGTEKCPDRPGFVLVKQQFKKNIGIKQIQSLAPPLRCFVLELNRSDTFVDMGKATRPAQAELLFSGFFIPLYQLINVVNSFLT